jgi:hypothetical protein
LRHIGDKLHQHGHDHHGHTMHKRTTSHKSTHRPSHHHNSGGGNDGVELNSSAGGGDVDFEYEKEVNPDDLAFESNEGKTGGGYGFVSSLCLLVCNNTLIYLDHTTTNIHAYML